MYRNNFVAESRRSGTAFLTSIVILSLGLFPLSQCGKKSPAVEVNGARIAEAELKKHSPGRYAALRTQYEKQLLRSLKELAVERMFELAGQEKKITGKEYIQKLMAKAPAPTSRQIEEAFIEFRTAGMIKPNASFEQLRGPIAQRLRSQAQRKVYFEEVSRLKKKYKYKLIVARPPASLKRAKVDIKGDPVRGNPNAKVTIVEFSDFECQYCQRAQTTALKLREQYGDKIRWVFKDFPLSFHKKAMGAHLAANCIWKQDKKKYWTFFDAIFSENRPPSTLTIPGLEKNAAKVGADVAKMRRCMKDPAMLKEIREDMAQGQKLGVEGTPGFFINGRFINGAVPLEDFTVVIDQELNN